MSAIKFRVMLLNRLTGSEDCDTSCASCMSCSDGGGIGVGVAIRSPGAAGRWGLTAQQFEQAQSNLQAAIDRCEQVH